MRYRMMYCWISSIILALSFDDNDDDGDDDDDGEEEEEEEGLSLLNSWSDDDKQWIKYWIFK